jgi:hypothetical protein
VFIDRIFDNFQPEPKLWFLTPGSGPFDGLFPKPKELPHKPVEQSICGTEREHWY